MTGADRSRKTAVLYKGALESAGLGEVAHFLKKAKQNLEYARYAIENTDFSASAELFDGSVAKISEITRQIVETRRGIEAAEMILAERADSDTVQEQGKEGLI